MKLQSSIFLLVLLGLSVGCASVSEDYAGHRDINRDALAKINKALEKSDNVVVKTNDGTLICRHEEVTGSRIPEVICLTPQQMEEDRQRSRNTLDMEQRRVNRMNSVRGGG